jgi:hypothetical protein
VGLVEITQKAHRAGMAAQVATPFQFGDHCPGLKGALILGPRKSEGRRPDSATCRGPIQPLGNGLDFGLAFRQGKLMFLLA